MKELNEAKVLAVGPGGLDKEGKRVTPSVAPGDKVLIPQVGGTHLRLFNGQQRGLHNATVWRKPGKSGRRGVFAVQRSRVAPPGKFHGHH